MENFIAIRNNDGQWKTQPTKFLREVGDAMTVEGKRYVVIAFGSRSHCTQIMNFQASANRKHRKNGYEVNYPDGRFINRDLAK